jgi:hypothetical protein
MIPNDEKNAFVGVQNVLWCARMPGGREKPAMEKVERTRIKEVQCYRGMNGRIESRKLGQEERR